MEQSPINHLLASDLRREVANVCSWDGVTVASFPVLGSYGAIIYDSSA